jgi:hypothetical protein
MYTSIQLNIRRGKMKKRWVLLAAAAVTCTTAVWAQSRSVTVTVSGSTATASPSPYKMAAGQASINVILGTRGYRITSIVFSSGSGLFQCIIAADGGSAQCAIGQKEPGGEAQYTVNLTGNSGPVASDPAIFIQSE